MLGCSIIFFFFFFKQKTAYEMQRGLVGSEMCIRDRYQRRVHGKKKKLKGRNMEAVVAAILYVAAKQCSNPRNMRDIFSSTGTKKKDVIRCVNLVRKFTQETNDSTEDVVLHMCNKLNLESSFLHQAQEIARKMDELALLGGRNPYTKGSVAIFLVSKVYQDNPSQDDIAAVAKITAATIRNSIKDVGPYVQELLPESLAGHPIYQNAFDKQQYLSLIHI
eukprot:TRINITY_DN2827_c0_g1_i10.p1 TRINITY_DN2827_c0_g1~~TRINITY_DN2827_c0_g1_i10.p1  ORF type:complete len:220 (-),score=61.07 TRINITY_DN2827_c0_g1_i10:164-823(-)